MKKWISALLAIVLILSMAACGGSGGNTTTEAAKTDAKTTLRIAVTMDAPGFNPYTAGYDSASALIDNNVYETLIRLDASGNLYPCLATEWTWGENNMSIILTLREGVKFTNGEAFNADIVIYALKEVRGATAVGGDGESLYDFDNMKKLGDYKVEIPLKRAGSDAFITLADMTYSIVSKKAVEEYGDDYGNNPVGTGPYKFVSFTSGVGSVMEANEDYWGGAPKIKKVETVLIAEASQAEIELENGNIDWVINPDSIDVQRIIDKKVDGLALLNIPVNNVKNLWFNFRKEEMLDENLRKAISCAIDKEAIIDVAYGGFATVANQKIANNNGAYDSSYDENPLYPYDIEKAKEYLSKSNYPNGLKLTLYSNTVPVEVHITECVKNDLAKIGIDVELVALDSNAAVPALIAGEEDYLYVTIGCNSSGYAPGFLKNASPNMAPNWGKWDLVPIDAEINALYEKSLAATDTDEMNNYVKQAIALEMEHAMAVPLCYPQSYMTCSAKLQGVRIDGGNACYLLKDAYFAE